MMLRALLLGLLLCAPAPAQAHKPSDSYLTLNVAANKVEGQWDIALRDLDAALELDQDGDGELTWDEIRRQHGAIAAHALGRLDLSSKGAACAVSAGEQLIDKHTDGAYTVLRFSAVCPTPPATLGVSYRLFAELDPQHRGLVKLKSDGTTSSAIFGPDNAHQELSVRAPGHGWAFFSNIFFTYIKFKKC